MTEDHAQYVLKLWIYANQPEYGIIPCGVVQNYMGYLGCTLYGLDGCRTYIQRDEPDRVHIRVKDMEAFFSSLLTRLKATEEQRAAFLTKITLGMIEDG